jgi:uncharacterized protein (TIGR03437 family)
MKLGICAWAGVLFASAAFAQQPTIRKVTNAASYIAAGLPGSGIAQGSIMYIEGSNLGPAQIQVAGAPRPTSEGLAGTRVRITVGGTNFDAPMIYTLAGQVSAIMPSNVPIGTANVTVIYNNNTSAPFPVQVVRAAFGIFTLNSAGSGPGVITNANFEPIVFNNTLNSGAGGVIWGTGLGGITTSDATGAPAGNLSTDVEVFVGGRLAQVLYKGRSPGFTGLDQINFVVPEGVEGCAVPVAVRVLGGTGVVSNMVSTSISRSGRICQERGLTPEDISRAVNGTLSFGAISLSRSTSKLSIAGFEVNSRIDSGAGSFFRIDYNNLIRSSTVAGQPPEGSCSVSTFGGENPPADPVAAALTPLDAGPSLTVSGPRGQKTMTRSQPGTYTAELGGGTAFPGLPAPQPDYLEPGEYTVTGPGGAAVGPFTARISILNPVTWSNEAQITNVPRTQDLTVTWTGGTANELVYIFGGSARSNPTVGGFFICYERAQAGRFAIPSWVLSTLPPSQAGGGQLAVGSVSLNPPRFTASGIDVGSISYSNINLKTVTYQ